MNIPFYDATREYKTRKSEFDNAISAVLEKGNFILGNQVAELEQKICEYSGAKYAVGLANGSDALVIASDILGFSDKETEVLVPTFTFFASASCVARLGAKPVFCDIDEDTFCMDMIDAEKRISSSTKGILPVHLFLQTADMDICMDIARRYNLHVLEDAAEAFGMKTVYKNENGIVTEKTAGTIGDIGVYSFFPTKTLGCYGDGGMLITNNEEYYKKAKSLRTHGAVKKYHHDYIGYNSRLDTLQASILNVKISSIDNAINMRARHAQQYISLLGNIPEITLPLIKDAARPVYYVFNVRAQKRDGLKAFLEEQGIGTAVYYPKCLHEQKCFEYLGYKKGDFPVAEKVCSEILALPMYPELKEDEINYICEKIKSFYKNV